jgi:hypothetical protein
MRQNSRLSGVLHILLHMAEHEGPLTSEMLARPSEFAGHCVGWVAGGVSIKEHRVEHQPVDLESGKLA